MHTTYGTNAGSTSSSSCYNIALGQSVDSVGVIVIFS